MLGILIRGVEDITVHTAGGLGFSCCDYQRPDLAPSRLGYVWVNASDINPTPPAPTFQPPPVVGSGIVEAWLTCSEAVTGFDLEWATSADQSTAERMHSDDGYFRVPANTTIWMWGRSVRGAAVSPWTPYGMTGENQEEFEQVWSDEAVTAANGTSYPSLQELLGADVKYSSNSIAPSAYPTPDTLAMWTVASAVTLSEFGGKVEFRGNFSAGNTNEKLGVVFGADVDIFSGWNAAGQSFYVLYLQYADVGVSKDFRARLATIDAGAETIIDSSGNIWSYISADLTSVAAVLERQGNTFRVYLNGALAWEKTDTTIPGSIARPHTGFWWFPTATGGAGSYFRIFDYLRVYSRNTLGAPASVDAGKYYDDLLGELTDGSLVSWDATTGQITDASAGAALTDALTTITHTSPGTPDYAVQDLTDTGGFGFATKDEGNSVLAVIANLQARVNELEARLQAHGLIS